MTVMLLEWIATSVFLILVVLALRAALGGRISAGLRYALWGVVLVRLLVPVQLFTSPLAGTRVFAETHVEQNQYPLSDLLSAPPDQAVGLPETGVGTGSAPTVPAPPDLPDAPEPPAAPDLTRLAPWLGWAWLAGGIAAALVLLASNLRFYWKLRRERVPLEGADCPLPVYAAVGLPSPCLFGGCIYVTPQAAADPAMLRHVLAHEYTHFRHGDFFWSFLRCGALAVHWWNPLVWLAAGLSRRDGELACDEGALRRLGEDQRAGYGATLLALVTAKPTPGDLFRCATTMAGDKKSLKERITRIAQAPRRWLWAAVAAVLAMALACLCAFGSAEPEDGGSASALNGLTADLSLTLDDNGNVSIKGTVDGLTLEEGTYWQPDGAPAKTLTMRYPPFTGGIEGSIWAYWEDGSREAVTINTSMMAAASSYAPSGYWVFTVDLSGEEAVVARMDAQTGTFPEGTEVRMYPESIDHGEAVRAARIAARLLTAAEDYYQNLGEKPAQAAPEVETACDVSAVPRDVLDATARHMEAEYEYFLLNLDVQPISVGNSGRPEFDGWRIKTLDGPWTRSVLGMDVEIWRSFGEYHTPEPEKAEYMLLGGMYVTKEGWFSPKDCWTYYIFELDQQGGRSLAAMMIMGAGGGAPDGETQMMRDDFDAAVERTLADTREVRADNLTPDLNGNGVPEEIRLIPIDGGMGQRLEVYEDGGLIFSEEGYNAHAGYNALFLCTLDGEDYLLRYNPYMGQGWCTYRYELFTLENGEERVVREGAVDFDLNFEAELHQSFDVNAIWDFVKDVNGLLANSVQLLNTDADLLDTFDRLGRLEDDLGWLGWWEPTYVRQGQGYWSLPNELWAFKAAMEERQYAEAPAVFPVDENGTDIRLSYRDKTARFVGNWDCYFQPAEAVEPQVLDLDGDGRDEIVVILVEGHGTGVSVDNLYVFDADTLEQYDTSGLTGMILESVKSTGDGENYYLTGPGLDETIPREDGEGPAADALALGDIVEYSVKDGGVFCLLGCDASGFGANYVGRVVAELEFSGGGFRCAGCTYTSF